MLKSLSLLVLLGLILSTQIQAQVGQTDPQNSFPSSESFVMVPAEYLAMLIQGQQNDEMIEDETLIDLEQALRDLENAKLAEAGIQVYPDETPDYLQLDLSYDKDYVITLLDKNDEVVITVEDAFGSNQLNLHSLAAGTYNLQLQDGDMIYRKRIEKE